MTIRRICSAAFAALFLVYVTAQADQLESAGSVPFSEAETRLWLTDQLQTISAATELNYSFEKSGSMEPGFSDHVRFAISKVNEDGTKVATLQFFSGERQFPVPPVERTTVNPILKVYLQGDVYEMNRLTDPDGTARERWRYFQRRIKYALAESATVTDVTFNFNGRNWQGHEVRFQPYINDPKRSLFARLADKSYSIIVCDELPGYLYRIETIVSGGSANEQPLLREVLQLSTIDEPD